MKIMIKPKVCFCAVIAALVSGCQVSVGPAPAPVVVAEPVVEVVPEAYVWDGVEYVGVYNGQYMYFGPAGVWVVCDPIVLDRFHGWERFHADWRQHAIRNDGAHRLDRNHRPDREHRVGNQNRRVAPEKRTVAPGRQTTAPERKTAGPERKTVAPVKKTVAPVKKTAVPAKKAAASEKKKDDKKDNK